MISIVIDYETILHFFTKKNNIFFVLVGVFDFDCVIAINKQSIIIKTYNYENKKILNRTSSFSWIILF